MPSPCADHQRQRLEDEEDRSEEVHADRLFGVVRRDVEEVLPLADAGVVDEEVEPAEALARRADGRACGRAIGDVADDRLALRHVRAHRRECVVQAVRAARDDDRLRTALGEVDRELAPDAGRGAGHDRDFPR